MGRLMKDSGIEWIGSIPESWVCEPIGSHFECRNTKVSDKDYPPLSVAKIGVVPQMENVAKTDANDARKLVKAGDFVINSRSDRKQSCGVADRDGSVSLINIVLCNRSNSLSPEYMGYSMKNYGFAEEFYRWGNGIVADLWSTRWDNMKRISIPIPPKQEQQKIATFLDQKCKEVDELIALQEKMIEELKAYKQSVITETITKGLNPDVPMKDSGIEWIGQIPEHWEVLMFSSLFEEHKQKNIGLVETNLLSLSYGKIKRKDINTTEGLLPTSFEGYNIIDDGDIVFRLTDLQNDKKSLRTGLCKERGIITSAYVTVRSRGYLCSPFFHYLFHSYDICKVFYGMGDGVRQGMNYEDLRKLLVLIPPITEQERIASYLSSKDMEIDTLISIKQSKIAELQDYKKSIIYEYVTGKKEVPAL